MVRAVPRSLPRPERGLELDEPAAELLRRGLEGALGVPFTAGNHIVPLKNGREIFPAMLEAIAAAEVSVDFSTYVYWSGLISRRFAAALTRAARRGVDTRVLLDAFGAMPMDRRLMRVMTRAGVRVEWFRPIVTSRFWKVDNRMHRKVLVCDGVVGFTGGVGIAEEWEGDARDPSEWRDTHFRIEGPAVHGLEGAFIGNWAEVGPALDPFVERVPRLHPRGDALAQVVRASASLGWSDIATLHRALLRLAKRRVRISTAYFVPDAATRALLVEAARRGVQVQVLVPGPYTDARVCKLAGRAAYPDLLRAGVEVFEYQPTMLHTKVITIDGIAATIGSANFNNRSMSKDEEVALTVIDTGLTAALDRDFDDDLRDSRRVTLSRWRRWGLAARILERAADLLRPQL